MATLYWSYEPRKHIDGNGTIDIDDSELSPAAKCLLLGAKNNIADILLRIL